MCFLSCSSKVFSVICFKFVWFDITVDQLMGREVASWEQPGCHRGVCCVIMTAESTFIMMIYPHSYDRIHYQ
jgi:hypothetical protein